MKNLAVVFLLAVFSTGGFSQVVVQGPGMPPGENIVGKVTAIAKDSLTVDPAQPGDPIIIKVGDNTRFIKERQPASMQDIKIGDTVFARGALNGQSMQAAVVGVVNPEMLQQRIQMGGPGGQFKPEDMGKKFIAGEVKAINETRLTIARPDNQTQEIEVDENTSFKKKSESVTLADIAVGDFVFGPGEIKNDVFVPKVLNVGGRPTRMRIGGPGGNTSPEKKPEDKKPEDKPAPPKN